MGFRVMTVLLAAVLSLGAAAKTDLERKISADHRILVSDRWGGGHRIIFDFNGRKGWIVEPEKAANFRSGSYPAAVRSYRETARLDSSVGKWLEEHPLTVWNWDGQFEDIKPCKPYANPTKHNAVETMFEILRRYPNDPARLAQCRKILKFCEDRFVCWEKPKDGALRA